MSLRVPKRHGDALALLLKLSPRETDALVSALEKAPSALLPEDLAARLARDVSIISPDSVSKIVKMLASLYRVREQDLDRVPLRAFVEEVVGAAADSGHPELKSNEQERKRFQSLLERLLSFDQSIGMTAKALGVMRENAHLYCTGRIISDLRPVFKAEVTAGPAAAIIVHSLRITYHEADDMKEFFVAMDSLDVEELRALCDRALLKTNSLKQIAKKSDLPVLEVESEP